MSGRATHLLHSFLTPLLIILAAISCSSSSYQNHPSWWSREPAVPPQALRFLRSFGSTGSAPGQFLHPRGLSVDPEGNIYIADTGNHRIQKFNAQGRFLREAGGFGWQPGQFSSPTGLSAREGLNIYVADSQNRRVQRLDRDLNYLSVIPASEDEEPAFGFLWDVEVASTGELFVSDTENEQVWKLTPFGQPDRTFGGYQTARERLRAPAALELGAGNVIYVADAGNDRIARYDAFGTFSGSLGKDQLHRPHGLALDRTGYLYVADTEGDRLCVFSPAGEMVLELGGTGDGPGSLRSPMDVVISAVDEVYVLDSGNSRVQVFTVLRQNGTPEP